MARRVLGFVVHMPMSIRRVARLATWLTVAGCSGHAASAGDDTHAETHETSCDTTYSRLEASEPVSFRHDVMPFFARACTLTPCHDDTGPAADLYLGPHCVYDAETGACVLPDVSRLANGTERSLSETADEVHRALLATSTVAPTVARVTPNDPGASFLVDKLADTQNDRGYDCSVPARGASGGPCGEAMPFGIGSACTDSTSEFDVVVSWILQGAEND